MAFPSDITIDTQTYSTIVTRPTSTVRQDPTAEINSPRTMTISHETAKSGVVSSVVYFDNAYVTDCNDACVIAPTLGKIRSQFKLSYNPLDKQVSLATIQADVEELMLFLTPENLTKLINLES